MIEQKESSINRSRKTSFFPEGEDSFEEDAEVVGDETHQGAFTEQGLTAKNSSTESLDSNDEHQLAKKETRAVFRLRVVVILALLLAAGCVSYVVFRITKSAQRAEFDAQFDGAAEKVLSSFEGIVSQKLGAIGSLTLAITSYALSQNLTWPFVTVDVAFEQQAATARALSSALHMSLAPIVTDEFRAQWEEYSVLHAKWYQEGFAKQKALEANDFHETRRARSLGSNAFHLDRSSKSMEKSLGDLRRTTFNSNEANGGEDDFNFDVGFGSRIYQFTESFDVVVDPGPEPYTPVWQSSPVTTLDSVNMNLLSFKSDTKNIMTTIKTGSIVLGGLQTAPPGNITSENLVTAWYAGLLSTFNRKATDYKGDPVSTFYFPVFAEIDGHNRTVVAVMTANLIWATYFENILPSNAKGIVTVLDNACDGQFTYEINGAHVTSSGTGDLHDSRFNHMVRKASFDDLLAVADGTSGGLKITENGCPYVIRVYPSKSMYDEYNTNLPGVVTAAVVLIFVFTAGMFLIYDRLVERRQTIVLRSAQQSSAIVSSLFPENVRARLMKNKELSTQGYQSPKRRLTSYLTGETYNSTEESSMEVIADLFPYCTVLFADIAGFTAWSSTRDPSQVFILLQTVYQEFDAIAKKRKVFKVETIGDSYVAVTGLPNPQDSHAVIMARFAWDCLTILDDILNQLEITLGPDTADLGMRFGMHSGAVTAGVLRGERARFQLFGDTVNTAARMESTGLRNCIQVSHTTADLLRNAGKGHWLQRREDSVIAKGKGVLNTFWLVPSNSQGEPQECCNERGKSESFFPSGLLDTQRALSNTDTLKHRRLVEWVVESLSEKIKLILAKRVNQVTRKANPSSNFRSLTYTPGEGKIALDELSEIIDLPDFDRKCAKAKLLNHRSIQLDAIVLRQLHEYVSIIASMYRNNPFHNFEHACHVTMSVDKFLHRIVTPDLELSESSGKKDRASFASQLHEYTHGITSDPLTLFAIVFSALIHDVDHRGVSNTQLILEEKQMAAMYRNKSVAEQNSLDLAWDLLMNDSFTKLRECLFDNKQSELLRFRRVIVNVVLATDIFDKELNDLRKNRWDKAFRSSIKDNNNGLKATIVIEHIIQASDVAHTMQHWHIYRKWNRRLFQEMYLAYKEGRMATDPSSFWYKGEIGFFDNYIIPLAKKLKECNVFGVSSDECLNYAEQNRAEWEVRGEELLAEMVKDLESTTIDQDKSSSWGSRYDTHGATC